MHATDFEGRDMGQTAGDCKVVVKDQQAGPAEQQPGAFHAQLDNFDHVHLLHQAGAKPTECPSLPPLTIDDQQTNANAIRPTDVVVAPGSNAIQSTYEALDRDVTPAVRAKPDANADLRPENSNTVSGSAGTFADCRNSVLAGPDPGDGSNCSPSNPANESIIPDENQNQNMILARLGLQATYSGGVPVNFEQPNINTVSGDPRTGFAYSVASVISGANSGTEGPNAAAIRPRYDVAGNAIQSTYEALDLDIKPWTPEVGCLVNPQQKNINALTPPDEAQGQSSIFDRLESQPAVPATKPQ
jgi:hypothetical protein